MIPPSPFAPIPSLPSAPPSSHPINQFPFLQVNLDYKCLCANNNSAPANIADYSDTLPNHICVQEFANCRQANPGSKACSSCGTLKPTDVAAFAASTSAAATTSASGSMSAGASAAKATGKSGVGRVEGGVAGVAVGVIAAVLL